MAGDRIYMPKNSPGPPGPKLFTEIGLVPTAGNMAGAMEVALERASVRTGIRPSVILAGLVGGLFLMTVRLVRRQRAVRYAGDHRLTVD